MGSENSKSAQKKEESDVAYRYGPDRTSSYYQTPTSTRTSYPVPSSASYSAPPPPYSVVTPSVSNVQPKASQNNNNGTPNLNQLQVPVPAPRNPPTNVIRPLQQKPPPPIPPLPHRVIQNVQSDIPKPQSLKTTPYKWQSNESLNMSSSQNYDSQHNPYVWKKEPTAKRIIDLNQELPRIQKSLKDNKLPSFQHFVKELSKNKELAEARKLMVNNKYLSDVKFLIGESVFYGHKMFLITASFLFYDHFYTQNQKEMVIESVNHETFETMINYCYTGKIQVTHDNVLELLIGGNKLQIRQITNICHGFITNAINSDLVFNIFEKALELENEIFQKKCLEYITTNEATCFASKGFFTISLPSLMKILEVCKYSREKVDEVVNKWTSGGMGMMPPPQLPPQQPKQYNPPPQFAVPQPKPQKQRQITQKLNQKGASKKEFPKKKNKPENQMQGVHSQSIPNLMSIPVSNPHNRPPPVAPFPLSYPYPPPHMHQHPPNAYRPFAGPSANIQPLINFDDDQDDRSSIISKDDEPRTKVNVQGARHEWQTEISRLDFVCKRSMHINEVWFSQNLATCCKEVRLTVGVIEQNKASNIHFRLIQNNIPGMRMNFVRFTREPLKVYVGQRFFVKLNFSDAAQRLNIAATGVSANPMVELCKDADVKKYFNCVSALVVSEMP